MKLKYDERIIGIYVITNIKNKKVYVGQSVNLYYRISKHFSELKRGAHICKEMQQDYNAGDKFSFEIIECEEEYLDALERIYIKAFNNKYNKDTGGKGCGAGLAEINRVLNTGRHASEETKRKMSESRKGKKKSKEEIIRTSKTKRDKKISKYSSELIRKIKSMLKDKVRQKTIAQIFNIPVSTVSAINNGKVGWWENASDLKDNPVAATNNVRPND